MLKISTNTHDSLNEMIWFQQDEIVEPEIVALHVQLNPGDLNCQGKLKLLRVIGVLNKKTRNT